MTLTDFLLARYTEDQVSATLRRWHEADCSTIPAPGSEYTYPCDCGVPERMAAEVEAKRRIVALHHPSDEFDFKACVVCQWDICCDAPKQEYHDGAGEFPCPTLRLMAFPFADHPDFREEWRL